MSTSRALSKRIGRRRALLMRRLGVIQSRADAGECITSWSELDAIEEEMRFLLDLERTIFLGLVRDRLERTRT